MAARERWGLFTFFGKKKAPPAEPRVFELVVIEGPDAGARFSLNESEFQLGRGGAKTGGRDQILLSDRSVSVEHAVLKVADGQVTLQHLKTATNPTLVNGQLIRSAQLEAGDRIALGLVVLELRALELDLETTVPRADADDAAMFPPAPPEISTPSRSSTIKTAMNFLI